MARRRKWRPPNNPTRAAQHVWRQVYPGDPWPRGWRVAWAGFMRGAMGLTYWSERRILLSHGDARRHPVLLTLVHEFVHVRCPDLRHGAEFRRLVNAAAERLGIPDRECPRPRVAP